MNGAFVYLTIRSLKNRTIRRLRRLREPRYLAGLIVGLLYLYWFVFRNQMRSSRHQVEPFAVLTSAGPDIATGSAIALWVLVVAAWLWPFGSRPWTFTGAEVNFFMTAPVTRRALVNYKLLRAQLGLLFGVAIAVVFSGAARTPGRWSFLLGGWLVFATFHLHTLGVSLAKASFRARQVRAPWLAWAWLAAVLLASGAIVGALAVHVPAFLSRPPADALRDMVNASRTGAAAIALWPFAAVVAPLFAAGPAAFGRALVPALAVVAAHYWWVLQSDAQLMKAAAAVEEQQASGERRTPAPVVRTAPFELAPVGRLETAVLWKNMVQFGRYASAGALVRVMIPLVVLAVVLGLNHKGGSLAPLALLLAVLATIIGPYMVRTDLRTDLPRLSVLKSWPISGRELLLGEMASPVLILSVVAWFLLAIAFALWPSQAVGPADWLSRATIVLAAVVAAPMLIAGQIVIQNAAVVLFPGWIVTGASRARGVEAMGQNMLLMAGTLFALAIGVLPAGAVAGALGAGLYFLIGWPGVVPAAVIFAGILLLEALLVVAWLGHILDRTDPAHVESAESTSATSQWP